MANYIIRTIIIFAIVMIGVALKKGKRAIGEKPGDLLSFTFNGDVDALAEGLNAFSRANGHACEADPENGRFILTERMSLASYGHFFPIYYRPLEDGKLFVEIGIKSRWYEKEAALNSRHVEFYDSLRRELA